MTEILLDHINKLHPISKEMTEKIQSLVKLNNYKAGEFILREGEGLV